MNNPFKVYCVSLSTNGFLASGKARKSLILDAQGNIRWHLWRQKNKVLVGLLVMKILYCGEKKNHNAEKVFSVCLDLKFNSAEDQ